MRFPQYVPSLLISSIVLLSLGGLGGSFQPSRIFLLLLLPIFLIRIVYIFKTEHIVPFKGIRFTILFFVAITLSISSFSVFWSVDTLLTSSFLLVLLINLTPIALIFVLTDKELYTLKYYIPYAWAFSALSCIFLAFYELTTNKHFAGSLQERGGGELVNSLPFAAGFHGNYNDFSLFLFFCITGCLLYNRSKTYENESHGFNLFIFLTIISMLVIIIINGSRGVIVSVLGMLVYYLSRRLEFKLINFLVLSVLISIVFYQSLQDNFSLVFMFLILKFSDFSNDLDSSEGRFAIINAGLQGFIDSYGAGVGAGAAGSFLKAQSLVLIPNPHNLILELMLSFGVVGFISFTYLIAKIFINSLSKTKGEQRFILHAFIFLLPIWGVVQSHILGFTYFWLILFTCLVFVVERKNVNFSDK